MRFNGEKCYLKAKICRDWASGQNINVKVDIKILIQSSKNRLKV